MIRPTVSFHKRPSVLRRIALHAGGNYLSLTTQSDGSLSFASGVNLVDLTGVDECWMYFWVGTAATDNSRFSARFAINYLTSSPSFKWLDGTTAVTATPGADAVANSVGNATPAGQHLTSPRVLWYKNGAGGSLTLGAALKTKVQVTLCAFETNSQAGASRNLSHAEIWYYEPVVNA